MSDHLPSKSAKSKPITFGDPSPDTCIPIFIEGVEDAIGTIIGRWGEPLWGVHILTVDAAQGLFSVHLDGIYDAGGGEISDHGRLDRQRRRKPMTRYSFRGWWSNDEKDDSPEPWEHFTVGLFGEEFGDCATEPEQIETILVASGKRILIVDRDADTCTDSPAPRVLKADADRLAEALREAKRHLRFRRDDEQAAHKQANAALAAYEGGGS